MRARTSDGRVVEVAPATARVSRLLSDLSEAFDGAALPEVALPNVSAADLAVIDEFCEREEAHRAALVRAEASGDRRARIELARERDDWTERRLAGMQDEVPSLMAAANYMHVECVMAACSVNIAEFIKRRTPDEMREYFRLRRR